MYTVTVQIMNTTTEDHLLLRIKASAKPDCVVQGQILQSVNEVQGCTGEKTFIWLYSAHMADDFASFFQWESQPFRHHFIW